MESMERQVVDAVMQALVGTTLDSSSYCTSSCRRWRAWQSASRAAGRHCWSAAPRRERRHWRAPLRRSQVRGGRCLLTHHNERTTKYLCLPSIHLQWSALVSSLYQRQNAKIICGRDAVKGTFLPLACPCFLA